MKKPNAFSHKQPKDSARERAVSLLARREHSRKELHQKLLHKGFDESEISQELDFLEEKGWLSDFRFTESWIRHRIQGGYGPYKIKQELFTKGIDQDLVSQCFEQAEIDWSKIAQKAWQKKYNALPEDWNDKAKQVRYLQYRGFYTDHIEIMFESIKELQGES